MIEALFLISGVCKINVCCLGVGLTVEVGYTMASSYGK